MKALYSLDKKNVPRTAAKQCYRLTDKELKLLSSRSKRRGYYGCITKLKSINARCLKCRDEVRQENILVIVLSAQKWLQDDWMNGFFH